jgi:hypothetical protein
MKGGGCTSLAVCLAAAAPKNGLSSFHLARPFGPFPLAHIQEDCDKLLNQCRSFLRMATSRRRCSRLLQHCRLSPLDSSRSLRKAVKQALYAPSTMKSSGCRYGARSTMSVPENWIIYSEKPPTFATESCRC